MSSVILFKIGYRDTTVTVRLGPLPMACLVAVEWALGFFVLAVLTVTLANTQPLINRLISGVFRGQAGSQRFSHSFMDYFWQPFI